MVNIFNIRTITTLAALLLWVSASAFTQHEPADSVVKEDTVIVEQNLALTDSLLDYAENYLGIRYRSGGKCPKGFDCSGFVMYVFKKFGYQTPASSSAIKTVGKEVKKSEVRPGDVIYFTGRNSKTKRPGHVGIVTEIKDGVIYFIHASVNKGISYATSEDVYYKKRFLGIRRVIN